MATIVTKEDIVRAFKKLGIVEGDTVLIHSALSKVGKIEGSAQTVIDALEGIIGKKGTMVVPTLSQVDFTNSYKTWHMDKPSDVGYLTEYFRKLPFVYRSNQETHSVAARGRLAYELTHEHTAYGPHICPFGWYAFADSSPWMKLYRMNAKIVFFGVQMRSNTMKHVVEAKVVESLLSEVKDENKRYELQKRVLEFGDDYPTNGIWLFYDAMKMQEHLASKGLIKTAQCGDATLVCATAGTCSDEAYEELMRNPEKWFSGNDTSKIEWINDCKKAAEKERNGIMTNRKAFKDALMLNRDPNWYHAIDDSSEEACRASMEDYFSHYEGAITDICLGVLEQTTIIPSDSFMWRGEKYLQKLENGHEVDYTDNKGIRSLYNCYKKYNVDPVQIFIDQMHKSGIRPWIALRMNDAHFGADETSFLHSDMFYEENAAGHNIGSQYGYFGHCFDFTYPRYKNAILGFIGEIVNKYDMFGLELDFMRECHCFDYKNNPDCHKIMTEYIREIKKLVEAAEKRVGHEIKISIRTCRSIEDAKAFGFDIKTLCEEGLIDVVIPTPRWSPSESYLPIKEWREALGEDIAIIGGIETNNYMGSTNTPENSKAYCAAFCGMGADGIYFNNHEYYTSPRNVEAWTITPTNALIGRREFVVLHSDIVAYPENRYKPLPLTVEGSAELPLSVAKVNKADTVKLVIDVEGEAPKVSIGVKTDIEGTVIEPLSFKRGENVIVMTPHTPLEYDFTGISTVGPEGNITVKFDGNCTVHYVKLVIDAK